MTLFEINVIHKIDEETRVFLASLLTPQPPAVLDKILSEIQELKTMNAETQDLLQKIDEASTELAEDIQVLIDKANEAGNVTAAEINAALAPKVAFLKQLAADTNAPIPELPPATGDTNPLPEPSEE